MLETVRNQQRDLLGLGFYGAMEGVRLINFQRQPKDYRKVGPGTVRRWLEGYKSGGKTHEPLWTADFKNPRGELELSFRDLIELRFIKAFRDAGVSLQAIRTCLERARQEVGQQRPFSTLKFRTDGKTIFSLITADIREGSMTDLRSRQNVFRTMIEPSLKDLEFDADELKRWRPLGMKSSIAVDPAKAFGRPVALGYGVTTDALRRAAIVEGSEASVARLYEVPVSVVRDAVDFEEQLAA